MKTSRIQVKQFSGDKKRLKELKLARLQELPFLQPPVVHKNGKGYKQFYWLYKRVGKRTSLKGQEIPNLLGVGGAIITPALRFHQLSLIARKGRYTKFQEWHNLEQKECNPFHAENLNFSAMSGGRRKMEPRYRNFSSVYHLCTS